MRKLQVITKWVIGKDSNAPAILSFLGTGDSAVDVTGQSVEKLMAEPNAVIWEVVCSESTYNAIAIDKEHVILWNQQLSEVLDDKGNVVLGAYEVTNDDDSKAATATKDIGDLQAALDKRAVGKIAAIDDLLAQKVGMSRFEIAADLAVALKDAN